ncbi:hypothetical protein SEVIR_1G150860v4, partial [Setaria viridis]
MLLLVAKGAQCYEDVCTVNRILYDTFKEASSARGLLGHDREWFAAFAEADCWATRSQLRSLFVLMVMYCGVSNEASLFDRCWRPMAYDIDYVLQKHMGMVIDELCELLSNNGVSITKYNLLSSAPSSGFGNHIIDDEEAYDIATLHQAPLLYSRLNDCQRTTYDSIVRTIMSNEPALYFVSGFGGISKTFLWNSIITYVRSLGKIILDVASSGIASLLLPGGRTAHSRFKIPIDIDETTICDIKRGTMLADLMKKTSLIIRDEAQMTHRRCFEALDHSLCDIMSENDVGMGLLPFGGMVVVLGGGVRSKIVDDAITNSPLWRFVIILELTMSVRLVADGLDSVAKEELFKFSDWVLSVGDGTLPTVSGAPRDDSAWIQIPDDMLVVTTTGDTIVSPTNDVVDEINSAMISIVLGERKEYLSFDCVSKCSNTVGDVNLLYLVEFLNSLKVNNFPNHCLVLKVGVPVMLLRNLNQTAGLCNGTRLIITNLDDTILEALYVPCIVLTAANKKWPFTLQRRQFPIRSLSAVGLYLRNPVFSHGLKILIEDGDNGCGEYTKNIVYPK